MMLAIALAKRNQNTNYIINEMNEKSKKEKKSKKSGFILCIYNCRFKKMWSQ